MCLFFDCGIDRLYFDLYILKFHQISKKQKDYDTISHTQEAFDYEMKSLRVRKATTFQTIIILSILAVKTEK